MPRSHRLWRCCDCDRLWLFCIYLFINYLYLIFASHYSCYGIFCLDTRIFQNSVHKYCMSLLLQVMSEQKFSLKEVLVSFFNLSIFLVKMYLLIGLFIWQLISIQNGTVNEMIAYFYFYLLFTFITLLKHDQN